jgi:hypothetical protein
MTIRTLLTAAILVSSLSTVAAGTFTFSNTNAIVINDSPTPPTVASPYPSTNKVSGIVGSYVTKVTVQIHGFAHSFPADVDMVLVGPGGQNVVLMGNVGTLNLPQPVTNIDLTLDDNAPTGMPLNTDLVSGTFKPTQRQTFAFNFPPPAPPTASLMGTNLSNFKNVNPNGEWYLFVVDDTEANAGVITGGWSLTFTTAPVALALATAQTNAVLSWTNAATGYTLQATPSLSPAAWTNVTIPPVVISGNYVVTNAMSGKTIFYRLAQ